MMKKRVYLTLIVIFSCLLGNAQPTYHDDYSNIFVSGGYQFLHQKDLGNYHTVAINAEMLYSFIGSKVGIEFGKEYLSFSPIGVLMFMPRIFLGSYADLNGSSAGTLLAILGFSALQFHIAVSDYLEVVAGWDALRFTRHNAVSDRFYIQGSLNAGINYFIGDSFYINASYQFNHPHNPLIQGINWLFRPAGGSPIPLQPDWLLSHSVSVKIGWMF